MRRRTEEWEKVGKNKKRGKILSEKGRIIKGERERREEREERKNQRERREFREVRRREKNEKSK